MPYVCEDGLFESVRTTSTPNTMLTARTIQLRMVQPSLMPSMIVRIPMTPNAREQSCPGWVGFAVSGLSVGATDLRSPSHFGLYAARAAPTERSSPGSARRTLTRRTRQACPICARLCRDAGSCLGPPPTASPGPGHRFDSVGQRGQCRHARAVAQVAPVHNPEIEEKCGLDVTLVLDASGSVQSSHAVERRARRGRGVPRCPVEHGVDRPGHAVRHRGPRSWRPAPSVDDRSLGPGGALRNAIYGYYNPSPPRPAGVDF